VAVDGGNIAESRQPSLPMEGFLLIHDQGGLSRRRFILAASASVICAPPIVRAASLMPVHALGPVGPQHYGGVQRVFLHCVTPDLSELTRAGMSAYRIAAELNRRKVSAVNGVPWDVASVISATNLMKILEPNWRDCHVKSSFYPRRR
jgi:hypothetical protein